MDIEKRWCYGCNEKYPLIPKYWTWANKEHTRFRTKCRKCTNWDSKMSHRIARARKKDKEIEEMKERWEELYKIIDLAVNGINKKGNKEEE